MSDQFINEFSEIPIVQNTSSRRRSARVAKKESKAAVDTPETVQEEPTSEGNGLRLKIRLYRSTVGL